MYYQEADLAHRCLMGYCQAISLLQKPSTKLYSHPTEKGKSFPQEMATPTAPNGFPKPHLQSTNGSALETQVCLEVLSDLAHQALEGQLSDEQLCRLLVSSDLSQSDSTRSVPVGLLDTSSGRRALAGSLGGQLLTWGLASSGLTGSLLRTGHGRLVKWSLLKGTTATHGENMNQWRGQFWTYAWKNWHEPVHHTFTEGPARSNPNYSTSKFTRNALGELMGDFPPSKRK